MTVQEWEIKQAYKRLSTALQDAYDLTEEMLAAKAAVALAVGEAVLDGRIDGKNESTRESQARRLFPAEYKRLDETEGWVRLTRHRVEMQRLEVDEVRARLRLAELAAQAVAQTAAE